MYGYLLILELIKFAQNEDDVYEIIVISEFGFLLLAPQQRLLVIE